MHAEVKSGLSGLFAWVGIPVLFAGVARLTFSPETHGHWPATPPVNMVILFAVLAFTGCFSGQDCTT